MTSSIFDILFVIQQERNVHVHSAFIPRSHNDSIGEVRIALFHRLKIPSDCQLGREGEDIKVRLIWTGKRLRLRRFPPVDSGVSPNIYCSS